MLSTVIFSGLAITGAAQEGSGGLGSGSGGPEPTEEPTYEPDTLEPSWEPTSEPTSICNVDNLSNQMIQMFIRGLVPANKVQACRDLGAHLRAITDGVGNLLGEPDYPLICDCLMEFDYTWAELHLACVVGDGIAADDVHDGCLNGAYDPQPTMAPTGPDPTMAPTDPQPTMAPTLLPGMHNGNDTHTQYPVEQPTQEPVQQPTQEPTQWPGMAPGEDQSLAFTVTWDVRLCCMTRDECEMSGQSIQLVLGDYVYGDIETTCTAVAGGDRRRNGGDTWDAQYEMGLPSQEAAGALTEQLEDEMAQNFIKSQIEADTGATVSAFEAAPPAVTEPKDGNHNHGGVRIVFTIAGVAFVGGLLGLAAAYCYRMRKMPTETEEALSPRLLNRGAEGESMEGQIVV